MWEGSRIGKNARATLSVKDYGFDDHPNAFENIDQKPNQFSLH